MFPNHSIWKNVGAEKLLVVLLQGAQKGHSLLKKKADALQMKFRSILKKIIDTKQTMGEIMKVRSAYFYLWWSLSFTMNLEGKGTYPALRNTH